MATAQLAKQLRDHDQTARALAPLITLTQDPGPCETAADGEVRVLLGIDGVYADWAQDLFAQYGAAPQFAALAKDQGATPRAPEKLVPLRNGLVRPGPRRAAPLILEVLRKSLQEVVLPAERRPRIQVAPNVRFQTLTDLLVSAHAAGARSVGLLARHKEGTCQFSLALPDPIVGLLQGTLPKEPLGRGLALNVALHQDGSATVSGSGGTFARGCEELARPEATRTLAASGGGPDYVALAACLVKVKQHHPGEESLGIHAAAEVPVGWVLNAIAAARMDGERPLFPRARLGVSAELMSVIGTHPPEQAKIKVRELAERPSGAGTGEGAQAPNSHGL